MKRIAVIFALFCALTSTLAFIFEDCGSEVGKFGDIIISNCTPADEKCIVHRGSETQVSIKFTPTKDITNMEAHAFGVLLNVPVPFPLEKPDVCKDKSSGLKCPLKKDQEVEYKTALMIEKNLRPLELDFMWDFTDENNQKVMCVKIPTVVK